MMTLTCDSDHGLMESPSQNFITKPGEFLPSMGYAAGWGTTFRNSQRLWLCPKCTGGRRAVFAGGM
jgi:rubredoxin